MTQNQASGTIYKLQPNISSHYLQQEVPAEDTETGLKELMLTLGLSVNSGCAGTELFTKDCSYSTHKGLLSHCYHRQVESLTLSLRGHLDSYSSTNYCPTTGTCQGSPETSLESGKERRLRVTQRVWQGWEGCCSDPEQVMQR